MISNHTSQALYEHLTLFMDGFTKDQLGESKRSEIRRTLLDAKEQLQTPAFFTHEYLDSLTNSWEACVRLPNGVVMIIWYSSWLPVKTGYSSVEVLAVSSDYPQHPIK